MRVSSASIHREYFTDVLTSNVDAEGFLVIEEADDHLLYLEDILKVIHAEFFRIHEKTGKIPDLKRIIPEMRDRVLQGVNLAFSSICTRIEDSRPYRLARSLGANVRLNVEPDSTHLVTRHANSEVRAACELGKVKLVTPEWLWTCDKRWEKVDERLFSLEEAALNTGTETKLNPSRYLEHPKMSPFANQLGGTNGASNTIYSALQDGGFSNPFMPFFYRRYCIDEGRSG